MYDIDYGALAATVNGRAPQRAIIIRLMSVLNIREADFPRLPASMRNMSESAPGRAP
jgi:formylmethanofuran dehydrogenase subunit E